MFFRSTIGQQTVNTSAANSPNAYQDYSTLFPGQSLQCGESLISTNGQFALSLTAAGSLILVRLTDTGGIAETLQTIQGDGLTLRFLIMQTDGNLVLYERIAGGTANAAVWASNTATQLTDSSRFAWLSPNGSIGVYDMPRSGGPCTKRWRIGNTDCIADKRQYLAAGVPFLAGEQILSADGKTRLQLSLSGNLELRRLDGSALWESGTTELGLCHALLRKDGSLAVIAGPLPSMSGQCVWYAPGFPYTDDDVQYSAVPMSDRLAFYRTIGGNSRPLYSHSIYSRDAVAPKSVLKKGEVLKPGEILVSGNRMYHAAITEDGSLRVAIGESPDCGGPAVFVSGTVSGFQRSYLAMQGDGNLVLYTGAPNSPQPQRPLWATNTSGQTKDCFAMLRDDGVLVVCVGTGAADNQGTLYRSDQIPGALLPAGSVLRPGVGLRSRNGRFFAALDNTGVLYVGRGLSLGGCTELLWSTHRRGPASPYWAATVTGTGELRIYLGSDPLFFTGQDPALNDPLRQAFCSRTTGDKGDYVLELADDGILRILSRPTGSAVWQSNQDATRATLRSGDSLVPGDFLLSVNRRYIAQVGADGGLRIFPCQSPSDTLGLKPAWDSGCPLNPTLAHAQLIDNAQGGTALAVCSETSTSPLWQSANSGGGRLIAALSDEGCIGLYSMNANGTAQGTAVYGTPTASSNAVGVSSIRRSSWMSDLYPKLQNSLIFQVTLPATHDSGAYEFAMLVSPYMNFGAFAFTNYELDQYLREKDVPVGVTNWGLADLFVIPWGRSTSLTLRQQLEQGVRSLDLRICRSTWDHKWRLYHGAMGVELDVALRGVREFLDSCKTQAPHEVILINMSHFNPKEDHVSADDYADLFLIIKDRLEPFVSNKSTELAFRSIAELTSSGPAVLLFIDTDDEVAGLSQKPQNETKFIDIIPISSVVRERHGDFLSKIARPSCLSVRALANIPEVQIANTSYLADKVTKLKSEITDLHSSGQTADAHYILDWCLTPGDHFFEATYTNMARRVGIAIATLGWAENTGIAYYTSLRDLNSTIAGDLAEAFACLSSDVLKRLWQVKVDWLEDSMVDGVPLVDYLIRLNLNRTPPAGLPQPGMLRGWASLRLRDLAALAGAPSVHTSLAVERIFGDSKSIIAATADGKLVHYHDVGQYMISPTQETPRYTWVDPLAKTAYPDLRVAGPISSRLELSLVDGNNIAFFYCVTQEGYILELKRSGSMVSGLSWKASLLTDSGVGKSLVFAGGCTVVEPARATGASSCFAVTADGRLVQIRRPKDQTATQYSFPSEEAQAFDLRFQPGVVAFEHGVNQERYTIFAITTEGRLAQLVFADGWQIGFPAESAWNTRVLFQPGLALQVYGLERISIYGTLLDGQLVHLIGTDRWIMELPAQFVLDKPGSPFRYRPGVTVARGDENGKREAVFVVARDGRMVHLVATLERGWVLSDMLSEGALKDVTFRPQPALMLRGGPLTECLVSITTAGELIQTWIPGSISMASAVAGGTPWHYATQPVGCWLQAGQWLEKGQYLVSPKQQYFACLTLSGDLAVYRGSGPSNNLGNIYSSGSGSAGSENRPAYLILQPDGRLILNSGVIGQPSNVLWNSLRCARPVGDYYAVMQDDGNFVVYAGSNPAVGNTPIWCSMYGFMIMAKLALRAANGSYVCAESAGAQSLAATRAIPLTFETFTVIHRGGDKIALQACNGQYVCAEGGGGQNLIANRTAIGAWETFTVVDCGAGKIAIQACNGQYVCAEGGGGQNLIANRTAIGEWETFALVVVP